MSENEFLKINPNLKVYYKTFENDLPKTPHNKIKIERLNKMIKMINFNPFYYYKQNKLDYSLNFLIEKNDYECKQTIKSVNNNKLTLGMNSKKIEIEMHRPFNQREIKVYSIK
jgi:hypothetical protein